MNGFSIFIILGLFLMLGTPSCTRDYKKRSIPIQRNDREIKLFKQANKKALDLIDQSYSLYENEVERRRYLRYIVDKLEKEY